MYTLLCAQTLLNLAPLRFIIYPIFEYFRDSLEHSNTVITAETLAGEEYSVDMYPALCSAARMAISVS